MAIHYPADHNIFWVVLSSNEAFQVKDKGIKREAYLKLPALNDLGTKEREDTLKCVLLIE